MKRVLQAGLFGAALAVLAFGVVPVQAQTQTSGSEKVNRFDASIRINPDATVNVTETIQYDFGTNQRHGIFRDIPVSYQTNLGNQSITLSNIHVTDSAGAAYPFSTSRSGSNEEIKIGDPSALVTGVKTYIISYTASRVIGYFDSYDELYWNVTGTHWQAPILEASADVVLPPATDERELRVSCYEGKQGAIETCTPTGSVASSTDNHVLHFAASRPLAAGEGLTVAVGFPKGLVYQPTKWENFLTLVKDNGILALPVIVFFVMFALWYRKGRDPRGRGTIVPEYESPDGITPLEAYTVLHEQLKNSAISAEIIYLATKGYLKITRTEEKMLLFKQTDYVLNRLQPKTPETLPEFDAALLDGLFASGDEVKLSDLKNTFYKNISSIKKEVIASVINKKYFPNNPNTVRGWYIVAGAAVAICSFWFGALGALALLSGVASGIIIIAFGWFMPKVTKEGAILRERINGLKMYMDVAEKDRINFHNAPEKNPAHFEALLPFAMLLGVEAAWAKQFEGIYREPPSWYNDPYMQGFSPILFAANLNSFSTDAVSTLASAPSGGSGSGGGGFSGGGFGGGGGGSW